MSHIIPSAHHPVPVSGSPLPPPGPTALPDTLPPQDPAGFVASVDRHLLFEQLSLDELARLDAASTIRRWPEGETIYRAGTRASHIYVNLEGAIYLLLEGQDPGEPPLLSEVLTGEIFGVTSVVGNRRYTTDAVTAEPCQVLSIDAETFLRLLRNNPQAGMSFALGVARVYMDRYLDLTRHL